MKISSIENDIMEGIKHGIESDNWYFRVWFVGVPIAYFAIVKLFRLADMWDFKTRGGSRASDIMAFEIVAGISVTYLGLAGVIVTFGLLGVTDGIELSKDIYYKKSQFIVEHLIYPMITFQGWNVLLCFFCKDLRDPAMIGHHLVTASLAYFGLHPYLHGGAMFFFGVAELTNIPLTVYDVFKYFKTIGFIEKYPLTYSLSSQIFGVSFIILRLIVWPYKSYQFWVGSMDLLTTGKAHSNFVVGFFLVANIFLTLLQFYWGSLIVGSLIGKKPKKEKDDNIVITNDDDVSDVSSTSPKKVKAEKVTSPALTRSKSPKKQ